MRASLLALAAFASLPRGSVFEGNGPRQSLVGEHSASNNGRSKYEPHQSLVGEHSTSNNGRSKYEPHQGKQETARRLKRMNHGLPR